MKPIDMILIAFILFVLIYIYRTCKSVRNDISFEILMSTTSALGEMIRYIHIDNDPTSFWFKTSLAVDELLLEISKVAGQYGYEYVRGTYHRNTLATFSIVRERKTFSFKVQFPYSVKDDDAEGDIFICWIEPN